MDLEPAFLLIMGGPGRKGCHSVMSPCSGALMPDWGELPPDNNRNRD